MKISFCCIVNDEENTWEMGAKDVAQLLRNCLESLYNGDFYYRDQRVKTPFKPYFSKINMINIISNILLKKSSEQHLNKKINLLLQITTDHSFSFKIIAMWNHTFCICQQVKYINLGS